MTLEDLLREAARKGLVSLTLYAEWSEDRKTTYWTCRGTPSARHGYVGVEHALDPVEAMQECLKALPGAKVRAEPKAKKEHAATAAVTEPADPAERTPSFDEWMK
jgi:hypothetical protein